VLQSYLPAFFVSGALCIMAAGLSLNLGSNRANRRVNAQSA
jgi:hypothetical protein